MPRCRFGPERAIPFGLLAVVLGLLPPGAGALADGPLGRPAIQRFSPDIEVYPRNFAAVQGPSGIVYVGNAEAVLSYDGSEWYKHPVGREKLARTLAHDGRGRLYVGGYNEFGYFETPVAPDGEFIDLTAEFELEQADFADIWQIVVAPEGVFFLALEDLFLYRPPTDGRAGETRHWQYPGRFGALARIDGRLLLQFRGEGLREFVDGEFVPVDGTEALASQLYSLLPLPGGGFVGLARDGRWPSFTDGRVGELALPDGFPDSSYFTASTVLGNSLVVLGSVDGWLYFLDPSGPRHDAFRISEDWIADLEPSAEGGLIAQTDHETLYVDWPARWTSWTPDHGLNGGVLEVLDWHDRWLVISNAGAYLGTGAEPIAFEKLDWTDFEAWDFEPLADGTGLLADSYALRHVGRAGVVAEFPSIQYPRTVLPSRFHHGRFYVGTEEGLAVLVRDADGFEVVHPGGDGPVVFSVVELGPGRLLLGTQGKGVIAARLQQGTVPEYAAAGAGIDFGDSPWAELREIDGEILALTEDAAWRRTGETWTGADVHGLDALRREGRFLDIRQAPDGTLWAFEYNRLLRLENGQWREMDIGPLYRGALTALDFGPDGRVLAGASGSVAIFDPDAERPGAAAFDAMLRSVRFKPENGQARLLARGREHTIPPEPFSIRFDYTLPGLSRRDEIRYRARLLGFESEFSDWETTSHYTYLKLKPGRYRFEVEARGPNGRVSETEPFQFGVDPPWHRSGWMIALRWLGIVLGLMLIVWWLMRVRLRRLERERTRLSEQVVERTRALVEANRKLKRMAEIDDLTGIANRRRFDQYLADQVGQCNATGRALSVALVDLDQFKPYNDRHGHLAGDRVLQRIAQCLTEGFGDRDVLVARFGGDEFAAVLPGVDGDAARGLAERTRDRCARACGEVELSIGIGVVPAGRTADAVGVLEAADHQLYRIKEAGRNGIGVGEMTTGGDQ
ncbi:MAG: GGDEF domain-containing protein [Wenzhouxiangellaceae bacterium]|nr:GGDEF domain-containing protein [Wenzhouxiangellaceae bacterium]